MVKAVSVAMTMISLIITIGCISRGQTVSERISQKIAGKFLMGPSGEMFSSEDMKIFSLALRETFSYEQLIAFEKLFENNEIGVVSEENFLTHDEEELCSEAIKQKHISNIIDVKDVVHLMKMIDTQIKDELLSEINEGNITPTGKHD